MFSDFLNLFLFDAKHQLGTVIKALQTKGQFQSLAEPNVVAESGKEASFLAGGEFPVPIAQGGQSNAISVIYKEFGVRLNFTPVIHGDRVHLKVRPEVSSLDFANGVVLQGFRIPALSVRRTETEVDLMDGQTFAIAGLINNSMNSTLQKIPGIGDIPILGLLFKSKAASKEQTELVVMITPQILARSSSGVTSMLPSTPEPFLAPMPAKKLVEPLPPAFTPARPSASSPIAPAPAVPAPAPSAPAVTPLAMLSPASAAAILNPPHPPVVVVGPNSGTLPATNTVAPAAVMVRPLSASEQAALDHSKKQDAAVKQPSAKQLKKQEEANRQQETAQQKLEAKAARQQAKRDGEAAKVAAEEAKRQAKKDAEAARLAAEEAKRVAEIERTHQKVVDEAAARAKEAEAKYQAELAREAELEVLMRISLRHFVHDERGVSLVFVCLGFMAMLSATTLAIDVGMFMTARSQAQNAADAGAHAGAVAFVFNSDTDRTATGPAVKSAMNAALANPVMGGPVVGPLVGRHVSGRRNGIANRVQVVVYRTALRGNPVDTLMGTFFGVVNVDISATATAEASAATRCNASSHS